MRFGPLRRSHAGALFDDYCRPDRSRPSRRDGSAKRGQAPSRIRARHRNAPPLPPRTRSKWAHTGSLVGAWAIAPTCRHEAAPTADPSRLPKLIFASASLQLPVARFERRAVVSLLAITSKARVTSAISAENSAVRRLFFGLITTSIAGPIAGRVNRTHSRNLRFIRLRSTAPPKTRPTVKPTRKPSPSGRGR